MVEAVKYSMASVWHLCISLLGEAYVTKALHLAVLSHVTDSSGDDNRSCSLLVLSAVDDTVATLTVDKGSNAAFSGLVSLPS